MAYMCESPIAANELFKASMACRTGRLVDLVLNRPLVFKVMSFALNAKDTHKPLLSMLQSSGTGSSHHLGIIRGVIHGS